MEIVKLKNVVSQQDHTAGAQDAPVTLLEYGNFECIHCGRVYPTIKEVRKVLGDNLRFVFRHFPTVRTHPHSLRAAEAAEAASAQGKFWEMHDQLFTHQQALEDQHLLRYAKRIGLDLERFRRDMSENTFVEQIETEYNRGLFEEQVTGTPTFYMNEERYTGATDVDGLLATIKQADTQGRIRLPDKIGRLRGIFGRLHRD
jgi:protein-disulfide isomerase